MKHAACLLTLIALLAAPANGGSSMGTTQKGPVRLTLRIYNTKVKPDRSLWYILELKNVGKEALRVDARCLSLEVLDPNGNPLEAQVGGERRRYERQLPAGDDYIFTPEELPEQFWLGPGRSTATIAWSDRGGGQYVVHKDDDVAFLTGYTELWTYVFVTPGKYRVRAVYDQPQPESWGKIQTPYAEFEVFE